MLTPGATFGGLHLGEFLPPVLAATAYLVLFARRSRTLASEGRPVPAWRATSFVCGAALAAAVQLPPLDTLADQVLVLHMAQHIVIGDLASLLIVLGLTGPIIQPLLRIRVTRPLRRLAHPIVALALWTTNLYAWHLPVLYQLADRHDLVHALEHASFLWFGTLLWLALVGPLPKPAWFTTGTRLAYVVGVRLVGSILGNVLIWSQTVLYPIYIGTDASRGINPLSDQTAAGGVMMVEQMILTILLLGWLFYRFTGEAEARQSLLDFAAERGVELSAERAARAVAAGSAERLRARLLESAMATPDPDSSKSAAGGGSAARSTAVGR